MSRKRSRTVGQAAGLALSVTATVASAAPAGLVDLSLEELMAIPVVGAAKYAQRASESPAAVSVITADDIRRFGWRTIGDLLASVRGFHLTRDRTYSYLGVRGFAPPGDFNNRVMFLIDGMRVNDNIYDSVMTDGVFPLDLALIERVEVVRGPGSSLYGGNALFATVNVITRNGASVGGTELAADVGSRHSATLRATAGAGNGDIDWLVSASGYGSRGGSYEFADIAPGAMSPPGADRERWQRFFGRLRVGDWRATLVHGLRKKNVPTGSYGTVFDDPNHREDDGFTLAELETERPVDASNRASLRLFGGRYTYASVLPYDYGSGTTMINRDAQRGTWWGFEGRWTSTAWAGHKWIAGVEYVNNRSQSQRNADDDGTVYLDVDTSGYRLGLYLQDELALGERTALTLGVRHDRSQDGLGHWSPRVALVHQAGADDTVKLLYGTAFRSANAYELHYILAGLYGNPALKAERIRSLEGVWEHRLGAEARVTAAVYEYRVSDMVVMDPATLISANAAPASARGAELEFERRWLDGTLLRASYSGQFLRQAGMRPDNSPVGIAKLHLALPLPGAGWSVGLEALALSRRTAAEGGAGIGGHLLGNANLAYRSPDRRWEASFGIYNLAGRRYDDPAPADPLLTTMGGFVRERIAQDGRTWRLLVTTRF